MPDPNTLAFSIVQTVTGEPPAPVEPPADGKNPHAVALGKLGGGKARATKLSGRKRRQIAKKAATARGARPTLH